MSTPTTSQVHRIALIMDGRVEDIIACPDRLNALLLSQPTIVSITDLPDEMVQIGYIYDPVTGFSKEGT